MLDRVAETILALFAGRARAAAIYGDLLELGATRSSIWFAAAYLRMLFTLTWRIMLALFVADVGREFIFNLAGAYFRATPNVWRSTGAPYLLGHMGPLLAGVMSTLWIVLPFAAVRYGLRDRFVQLTFPVALGATLTFLFIPWASPLFAAATLALVVTAFFSRHWRRPLVMLLAVGFAGFLLMLASSVLQPQMRHATAYLPGPLALAGAMLIFQGSLLLLAFICSRLHRRFLCSESSGAAHA